jgi:hypothetical protein
MEVTLGHCFTSPSFQVEIYGIVSITVIAYLVSEKRDDIISDFQSFCQISAHNPLVKGSKRATPHQ